MLWKDHWAWRKYVHACIQRDSKESYKLYRCYLIIYLTAEVRSTENKVWEGNMGLAMIEKIVK